MNRVAPIATAPAASIEVVAIGGLATVQDEGRAGWAHLGVSRSGAADLDAFHLANRLVGNPENCAVVEITGGGFEFRLSRAATVALTGALCPGMDSHAAATLAAGTHVMIGWPLTGLRSYLAVRGGIDVEPVLGSRSTDTLSGLGPAPLQPGDLLTVGPAPHELPAGFVAPPARIPWKIKIVLGPRDSWFSTEAVDLLLASEWQVSADSDRIGTRLLGPALPRAIDGELPSEPTLPGALQIPPNGQPILFGPDAPVTGGYPVIATVVAEDLSLCGQLSPGSSIRFRL
jgi:biotin-dependent carboxylase-like uncharacterized protein